MLRYSGMISYPPDKVRVYVNNIPVTVLFIDAQGSLYTLQPLAKVPYEWREDMFPSHLHRTESSLYISHPIWSFYGAIDELKISGIVDPDIEKLDAASLMGYPQVIYFDSQGRLDPEHHEFDVVVRLTENPLYKPPVPESEQVDFTSRGGGMSSPISADEALEEMKKDRPPESFNHAIITINKYGKIRLEELVEEEREEE